jgi:hypothetical protein
MKLAFATAAVAVLALFAILLHSDATNVVNPQTGTTYTFVASECGQKLVTFSNTSPVAVTLPQANGIFGACILHLKNLNIGTVTVTPTTSTINGNPTLTVLPFGHADIWSDGTNYEATYSHTFVQAGGAVQAGDTITNPSAELSFATTLTLPANLPAGALVDIHAAGIRKYSSGYNNSGGGWRVSTGPNGTGSFICAGDDMVGLVNNNNNGYSPIEITCQDFVRTTGTSGTIYGDTLESVWSGDCYTGSQCSGYGANRAGPKVYPGPFYPGYNYEATQCTGYSCVSDLTLDTTKRYTLYLDDDQGERGGGNGYQAVLRRYSIRVTIP